MSLSPDVRMTDESYPDALPAQHRLHWYVLERVLGQGGFGITYLARDTNLDQAVAIKEYLPVEVATRQADATIRARTGEQRDRYRWGLDRFIREARTLARFDHRSIVRVLSVFELNGTAYMVMRFEDGENFAAVLDSRGTLPEDELLGVLLPVLEGLELVHDAGFIHRDIKPDNLHIRTDGTPVLLDFGSARHALGKAHTLTILVAPGYAPFEQYYSNSENQGPWTDIYSLGATCYRAISGRAPLDAISRSKGVLGSTKEVLVPAAVIGAGRYSGKFLAAIDHALGFAEKDRPQTIAEWRQELVGERPPEAARPAAKESGAPVRDRPAQPRPPASPPPPAREPDREPGGAGRPSWTPIGWGVAGAALAAIAIGLLLHFSPAGREATPSPAAPQPPPAQPAASEVATLEKKLVEERERAARAEAERKRLEDERATAAKRAPEPSPPPPATQSVPEKKPIAKPEAARPVVAAAPKSSAVPEPKPSPAPPPVPAATEPSSPSTPAQELKQLATAERAIARSNYAEAAELLKPLAERGDAGAMYLLGTLHLQGQGVARSDQDAARLLGRAAEQGYAKAQLRLGDLYATGRGVVRDDQTARAWYQKAAGQGDIDAEIKLGDIYASGIGVPQSAFQAYVWYGVAARAGSAAAGEKQARIAPSLQPAEIQQADKLIASRSRPKGS